MSTTSNLLNVIEKYAHGDPKLSRMGILWMWSTKFAKVGCPCFEPHCSASSCEQDWSLVEHIHLKKRNRLEHHKLNDIVFVQESPPFLTNEELDASHNDLANMTIQPISTGIDVDQLNLDEDEDKDAQDNENMNINKNNVEGTTIRKTSKFFDEEGVPNFGTTFTL
ncbi:hypothetical protein CR513_33619, partial [Mucuna pruriens]